MDPSVDNFTGKRNQIVYGAWNLGGTKNKLDDSV